MEPQCPYSAAIDRILFSITTGPLFGIGRCTSETNRIHLVLFGMQSRTSGPNFAAINRILINRTSVPNFAAINRSACKASADYLHSSALPHPSPNLDNTTRRQQSPTRILSSPNAVLTQCKWATFEADSATGRRGAWNENTTCTQGIHAPHPSLKQADRPSALLHHVLLRSLDSIAQGTRVSVGIHILSAWDKVPGKPDSAREEGHPTRG
jgi:hypothetical protein